MAAVGALIAVSFKKISHLGLCILISFAAGALLAVAMFDILPETVGQIGWAAGLASALAGYGLFFFLGRFVSHVCPACSATHAEINFKAVTITMVVAMSVHSAMDGLAIYYGNLSQIHATPIGLVILLGVAFHKFPEGMALALVARGAGLSRMKAFLLTVGFEAATTLAGGFIGLLIGLPESPIWIGWILGFVGGGFVYIVIHALLSEVFKHHPLPTILAASSGAGTIFAAGWLLAPHAH